MPLSGHCVGTNPETSSHATFQGTFGYSHLSSLSHFGVILELNSGISARELISTKKNNKKTRRRGIKWSNVLPKSPEARKKATTNTKIQEYVFHDRSQLLPPRC